jgi:hypothetical protein
MSMPINAQTLAIIILLLFALVFTFTIRRKLSLFTQVFAYFIVVFLGAALSLFLYSQANFVAPLRLYLDIKGAEFNYYATFSSMLLFTSCVTSLVIALFLQPHRWWHILLWLYMASLFLFLALDEYFQIHEAIYGWEEIYASVAVFTTLLMAIVFWRGYPRSQLIAWVIIIGGMGTAAAGGLGLEKFVAKACFQIIQPYSNCSSLPLLEEILEALGYGTAAVGMLFFAEQAFVRKRWDKLKVIVGGAWLGWILMSQFTYWLQPALENRFSATPVYANFADSQLILSGYHINREYVSPGEDFTISLYWRVGNHPSRQYGYTVNLVNPVTGESVLRYNTKIIDPTTDGWFVGTTHRTSLTLTVPEDVQTPISPNVVITLWRQQDDSSLVINPEETDRPVFGDASPIIAQLPIISAQREQAGNAQFEFANGARLVSYEINTTDAENITFTFQWSTTQAIPTELSQMLHIVHENGEDRLIFDQTPFQGVFPTTAWVQGMNEIVTWHLTLPAEAKSGTYTIYTGLYDASGARVSVADSNGSPIAENVIPIGEIHLD